MLRKTRRLFNLEVLQTIAKYVILGMFVAVLVSLSPGISHEERTINIEFSTFLFFLGFVIGFHLKEANGISLCFFLGGCLGGAVTANVLIQRMSALIAIGLCVPLCNRWINRYFDDLE